MYAGKLEFTQACPKNGDGTLFICYSVVMPRLPRTVFAGLPHHVTQRGNRREAIFFSDEDRLAYLSWLKEYAGKHQVEVLAPG